MGPVVVDPLVIGVTITLRRTVYPGSSTSRIEIECTFFPVFHSSSSSLLLPPLFPIVGRTPYTPAHCSAIRGEASSLARPNPLPCWLAGTENPNGRTD